MTSDANGATAAAETAVTPVTLAIAGDLALAPDALAEAMRNLDLAAADGVAAPAPGDSPEMHAQDNAPSGALPPVVDEGEESDDEDSDSDNAGIALPSGYIESDHPRVAVTGDDAGLDTAATVS